jgi:hypothetical protein
MTITALPSRNEYTATAGQTLFSYTFKIFESTDLNVYVTPAGQDADDVADIVMGYSVTGLGDEDGGTITLVVAVSVGDLVTIVSDIPENRTTDYQRNGDFRPVTVNADFDRVVSLTKQIDEKVNRSLITQESQQGAKPLTLPEPEALDFLRWKADLSGLENVDPVAVDTIVQGDFVERVINLFSLLNVTSPDTNKVYIVSGFFFLAPQAQSFGGGNFIWQAGQNKNAANGGTIIDPDNIGGFDGTQTTLAAFLTAQGGGVGVGCWVRLGSGDLDITFFGAEPGDVHDAYASVNATVLSSGSSDRPVTAPSGRFKMDSNLDIPDEVTISGAGMPGNAGLADVTDEGTVFSFTDATGPAVTFSGTAGNSIKNAGFRDIGLMATNTTEVVNAQFVNNADVFERVYIKQNGTGGGLVHENGWVITYKSLFIRGAGQNTSGVGLITRNGDSGGGLWYFESVTCRDFDKGWEVGYNDFSLGALMSAVKCDNCQISNCNDGVSWGNGVAGAIWAAGYIEDIENGSGTGIGFDVSQSPEGVQWIGSYSVRTDIPISIGASGGGSAGAAYNTKISGGSIQGITERGVQIYSGALTREVIVEDLSMTPEADGVGDGIWVEDAIHHGVYLRRNDFDVSGARDFANRIVNPDRVNVIENEVATTIKALSVGANIETLTAAKNIEVTDPKIQTLIASGAARAVKLPVVADAEGMEWIVTNAGVGGFDIIVDEDDGTDIISVTDGVSVRVWCDGVTWRFTTL